VYRLKIVDTDLDRLRSWAFSAFPREAGAFALAGAYNQPNGADVLVRRPVEVPPELFRIQREERLEVDSKAVNGLAGLCEANKLGAIVCHSHPGDIPYSPSDDYGERRVFEALVPFVPKGAPLASLLFCPDGIRGRVWLPNRRSFVPISEIVVLGRCIRRICIDGPTRTRDGDGEELFSRQVLAFGTEGQHLIASMKVGIIGLGGTGSPTAEQLARLGVRDILLVDHDTFSASNLTRMYGSFAASGRGRRWLLGGGPQLKVDLIAKHMRKIRPGVRVTTVPRSVVLREAARRLLDRDVLFLCTDEHWGRSVVNELAYQYLIPVINIGMSIRSQDGAIGGAAGAVDVIRPGTACLWCSQFLNAGRIAAESLPRHKRRALHGEGYVEDIDTPAPSVISVTTTLSGLAVTAFLQLATDFMGASGAVSRLRYDVMEGTVRRGTTAVQPECVCQKAKAFGDLRELPTLAKLPVDD